MNVQNEINEIVKELILEYPTLPTYEILDIAVKIQFNEMYAMANVINYNTPTALEKIAMELDTFNKNYQPTFHD